MHYQFMASINIKFINSRGDVVAHHLQRIAGETAAATMGKINNEREK